MTTSFQPGGPQAGGRFYGTTSEPQQYRPAAGYPTAPAPQVDYHHPYSAYQSDQAAWSQPMAQPMSQPMFPPVPQQYQPPTWTTPVPGGNRNKFVAAFIAVVLLLVAGAVTVIVMVNKGDSAAPAGPQAPHPPAPVVSAPDSTGPVAPQPFPSTPAVPAQTAPAETVPAQPASTPGRQEAEQAAGGFVDALRSSDFTRAATYVCSAKAAAFAAGASQLSTKVQLETLELSGVQITGSSAVMAMTYQVVGHAQNLSESLPMTVESEAWKICN